jgi:tRNA (guanine37-N1)-methyltransferase
MIKKSPIILTIKAPFDILGNIALVKFPKETKAKEKKKFADSILKKNKSITTILEKTGKFSGRLRKQETKYIAGIKTKEALYRENNCVLRFNVDNAYFSPRLSNERKEITEKIKKGDKVLVMFAGVAPYSVAIAKNSNVGMVYSNELNKVANKYGRLNAELNNVKSRIVFLDGDIKKIVKKIADKRKNVNSKTQSSLNDSFHDKISVPSKFDSIIMPRPQLKDSFLREAFLLSKKGTRIFYYDFCKEDEIEAVIAKVKFEALENGKKIKILKVKRAGEIAPYRYRIRIDFKVL